MRLTSTGLGIGTSSPGAKLDVNGAANIGGASAVRLGLGTAFAPGQAEVYGQGSVPLGIGTAGAQPLRMYTNSVLAATLDSSGNLGLGVTPSAWWSSTKAFQFGAGGVLSGRTDTAARNYFASNAYLNSTPAWTYIATNFATRYEQNDGQHQWLTAPSGTSGNAISFTQAMTLDASGNLGVGITSPNSRLDVVGGTGIRVNEDGASTKVIQVRSNFAGVGPAINVATNDPLLFQTNNTERARITAGGVLCVGTTATNSAECLSLFSSTIASSNVGLLAIRSGKSGDESDCIASFVKFSSTNTTSQVFIRFGVDNYNSGCGQINANGASQAAFGSFSDRRLKDNIVDLASQWDNIKTLRPVEFDYIASEGGGHQLGFIAQEVKEVYPDLVGERKDGMLTISGMGKGESRLIKALQEAMARIEQLEADMAALKASA
jgi:hypothetical protein